MELDINKEIKDLESKVEQKVQKIVAPIVAKVEEELVDFDQFWMSLPGKVQLPFHLKEILKADFKARGLSLKEPMSKYDAALRKFGYKF